MEDRIRQILQEQIAMRGGYGTHAGAVKAARTRKRDIMSELGMGDMANERAAMRNPWINYLKNVENSTGIPYNELMVDPGIKQEYNILKGSGELMGGDITAATRKGLVDWRKRYNKYKRMGYSVIDSRLLASEGDDEIAVKTTKRKPTKSSLKGILGSKVALSRRGLKTVKGQKHTVTKSDLACLKRLGFNETQAKKYLKSKGFNVPKAKGLRALAYNRLI